MLHKCLWNIRGRIQEPPPFLWTPLLPRTPPLPKNPLPTQEHSSSPRTPFLPRKPLFTHWQEPPSYPGSLSLFKNLLPTLPLSIPKPSPPPRTPCLPKDPVTAHASLPECQDEAKQFVKVIFCSLILLKNNWLYFWLWSHCLPFLTTLQLVMCVCPTLTCLLQSL